MLSKRMSLAAASSCGSLAESSFMARSPFFSAGPDMFSSPVLMGLGPSAGRASVQGSAHPFDGRAFPFRLDHLRPGEVHAQDHEPLTVRGAGEPIRFFLGPGRFGLQVDRQAAVRGFLKPRGCVPDRVAPYRV